MDFILSIVAGIMANTIFSKRYDAIVDKLRNLRISNEIKKEDIEKNKTTLRNVQDKLRDAKQENNHVIIIGSIYLDIKVDPVETEELGKVEWTGIYPIQFTLAGSAIYVGQYLYKQYQQESYLISVVGQLDNNSVITNEANRLLLEEGWIIDPNDITPIPIKDTATTISLIQRENNYATMFTHTGALESLTWELIEKPLNEKIKNSGVIYFSGFLKTGLYQNLDERLRPLSKQHIICIDHGRLMPEESDNNNRLVALNNAFVQNAVDIYICTFNEILNYHNRTNKRNFRKPRVKKRDIVLKKIARKGKLPPITIVRGISNSRHIEAYIIICKEVHKVAIAQKEEIKITATIPKAIFNAVILQELLNNQEEGDIKTRVKAAVIKALENCHKTIEVPIRGEPKNKTMTKNSVKGNNDKEQRLEQILSELFPEENNDSKVEKAMKILLGK